MNQVLAPELTSGQTQVSPNVGEALRTRREQRNLTLDEIAQRTFIKRHYLEALEAGQFQILPAPVYTSGYIRQYARVLGMEEAPLIQLYHQQRQANPSGQAQADSEKQMLFAPVISQEDGRVKIDTVEIPQLEKDAANEMDKTMAQHNAGHIPSQVSDSVEGTRKEALAMRYQTEQFAEQVFTHLEDEITKTLTIIRNGRSYLQQRLNNYQH